MIKVKLNFATSRPFIRYRYEDGPWQLSSVFTVSEGQGEYRFTAIDAIGCRATITIDEEDLDFPDGPGSISINKTVLEGQSADKDVFFRFSISGPVSFENVLVSENEPVTLSQLPVGTYTVKEEAPPTGYLNNNSEQTFEITEADPAHLFNFENEIDPDGPPTGDGQITLSKRILNSESVFGDFTFRANITGPVTAYGLPVTENTDYVLENLPFGSYEVEEIALPENFFLIGVSPSGVVLDTDAPTRTVEILNVYGEDNTGPGEITIFKNVVERADSLDPDIVSTNLLSDGSVPEGSENWIRSIHGVVKLDNPERIRIYHATFKGFPQNTEVYRESEDLQTWTSPQPITVNGAPSGAKTHAIKVVRHNGQWFGGGHGPGDDMFRYSSADGITWDYHSVAYQWRLDGHHNFFYNPQAERWEWYGRVRGEDSGGQPGRWATPPYERRGISRHLADSFFGTWTSEIWADPLDYFTYEAADNPAPDADQTVGPDFYNGLMGFWDADREQVRGLTTVFFRDPQRGAINRQNEAGENTRWTGPFYPIQTVVENGQMVIESLEPPFNIDIHNRLSEFPDASDPGALEVGQITAWADIITFKGKEYCFYYLRDDTHYETREDRKHETSIYSVELGGLGATTDHDDQIFEGDLQGPLNVPGVRFSVNSPTLLQNLPLGTYEFLEDVPSGYYLAEKIPLFNELTEQDPEGEFLLRNEFGDEPFDDFEDELFYMSSRSSNDVKGMFKCVGNPQDGITILETWDFPLESELEGINEAVLRSSGCAVLLNRNVVTYASGSSNPGRWTGLWLFDPDLNQLNFIQRNQDDVPTGNTQKICVDFDDSIIFHQKESGGQAVIKYDKNLNFLFKIQAFNNYQRFSKGLQFTKNHIVFITGRAFEDDIIRFYDKKTGGFVKEMQPDVNWNASADNCSITNYTDGRFLISGNNIDGDNQSYLFDENANIISGPFEIALAGGMSSGRMADAIEDGTLLLPRAGSVSGSSRLIHVDSDYNEIWSTSNFGRAANGGIYRTTDPNILITLTQTASDNTGSLHLVNLDAQTVESLGTLSPMNPSSNYALGRPVENWQVQGGAPDPPTGENTVTVQKVIQDGIAADDDVEFTVSLLGPANYMDRIVTVNNPLVLPDLPDGEYLISETTANFNFSRVSIEPNPFVVGPDNREQTVVLTNKKLSGTFAQSQLEIVDVTPTNEEPGIASESFLFEITQAAQGEITVQDVYTGGSLVQVSFNTETQSIQTIVGNVRDAINGAAVGGSIVTSQWNSPITASVDSVGSRLILTSQLEGSIGNNFEIAVAFNTGISVDGQPPVNVVKNLTGGSDVPFDVIEITYPFARGFNSAPTVTVEYDSKTDSRNDVAEKIRVAVNANSSINITASRTDNLLTFTEKREGQSHAGKVVRVRYNSNTLQISPVDGKLEMMVA